MIQVEDRLYPSDNWFDVPTLDISMQAGRLELPCVPFGTAFKMQGAKTMHYYVEDYRFAGLWENPAKGVNETVKQAVEPNYSLFDTTPVARGLERIYRKRWIARWWQDCGIRIYADLNVSAKFYEYNLLGIQYHARMQAADKLEEHAIAQRVSECDRPNMIVYGGGKEIHEYCMEH